MENLLFPKFNFQLTDSKLKDSKDYLFLSKNFRNKENKISQEIKNYHTNSYRKIKYEEFENSTDYFNQKILISLRYLEEAIGLDDQINGFITEHLFYEIGEIAKKSFNINVKSCLIKYF